MKRKGGFRLFLSSCIPGCGEMYQGYMKRGLSLLTIFFLIIAAAILMNFGELAVFLPLVWLYAFFDSYNLRGQTDEEVARNPDEYLFQSVNWGKNKFQKRYQAVGWTLIIVGVLALCDMISDHFYNVMPEWAYELCGYYLPRLIVTALIIALGVWFIRGPRRKKEEPVPEDFDAFKPPVQGKEEVHPNENCGEDKPVSADGDRHENR